MKKTKLRIRALSALFAFLMCFSCFASFSIAASTATLTAVSSEVTSGDTVTVTLTMSGNTGVAGLNVRLEYDSDVLTPISVDTGSALSGKSVTSNFDAPTFKASSELITFILVNMSDIRSNGSFFTVTFKAKDFDEETMSAISIECIDASNQNGDDVSVRCISGSVKVLPGEDDDKEEDKEEETTKADIRLRTKAHKIKYMVGRTADKFVPDAYATRYEVVECFYNLFDVDVMATDKGFRDISPKYKSMVNLFASAGVIKGYDDDGNGKPEVFKGDNTITRAEFCVLIVNLMDLDISRARDQGFPDVKGNNWYVPYVNAVAKAGYVKGRDTGKFDPNGLITRAEVATLINRITGVNVDAATTCVYGDVSPNKWYFKQVAAAAK
ncbi:MAG: S-layer homology domain-containing protein [Clostridia bacterium]|nr:S-layer homology domain-containing protein [Clostridia bacterium]